MIQAVGASHEEAIESDLQHISRMGLDGIRLSFWGDSECCDEQGNLVDNEHLRLLDYLVFQAKQRGIYMLFSPIVTYSPNWPDNLNKPMGGINSRFSKSVLGTDPNAIKAQANYLSQIITHVNRYTSIAYKDEPAIIGVELVNEPIHHPEDETKALEYINTLSRAVKKAGCVKPLFFNVSQDMRMAPILAESMIDGVTFGWYPSDLLNGFSLRDNYLVNVEVYAWMRDPVLEKKAKLVYEFDAADIQGSYMYPAMARTFRTGGSQFAAMFTYDSLPIASTNIEFQTHYFNLVYTPQKAVSLIIASEAFHRLPRLKSFGSYPQNCKFEVFQVSYEQDLSEMIDESVFMYSNDTQSLPLINEIIKRFNIQVIIIGIPNELHEIKNLIGDSVS